MKIFPFVMPFTDDASLVKCGFQPESLPLGRADLQCCKSELLLSLRSLFECFIESILEGKLQYITHTYNALLSLSFSSLQIAACLASWIISAVAADVKTKHCTRATLKCLRLHKDHRHPGDGGIKSVGVRLKTEVCKKKNKKKKTDQRVLLPGGQVQRCVVQAVHKVPEAGHVHLVLHGLGQHHTRDTILFRVKLFSYSISMSCDNCMKMTYCRNWNQNFDKETCQGMLDVLVLHFQEILGTLLQKVKERNKKFDTIKYSYHYQERQPRSKSGKSCQSSK